MNIHWKRSISTGVMLVAAGLGNAGLSDAAGRIGDRLATARAGSAKEKPAAVDEEDSDKPSGGWLGRRNLASGKPARGGKRKEVPPEAKEALDHLQGLQIDLGDSVESLDAPPLTPPEVPPTDEHGATPATRTRTEPRVSGEPRVSRRPTVLKRADAPKTESPSGPDRPQLTAPAARPASSR